MMNDKFFNYDNQNYYLKMYDQSDENKLQEYCSTCADEEVVNNSSIKNLKMGRWENDQWWVVYNLEQGCIVSVSGAHPMFEYEPGCWRVMFRLGTIKKFRGKAGPMFKDQRNCFGWGRMLPYQIAYCKAQGAKKIVFTTNCDSAGDVNSLKQNRICSLVFERLNMAKRIDQQLLYNTRQNVWEVLIEDVLTKKLLVL